MTRKTKLIIILGTNGTGKTTLIEKFVNAELDRVLVVTPDDRDWLHIPNIYNIDIAKFDYIGARRRIWQSKTDLSIISGKFRNGLIVFDDCRSYFKANLDIELHSLLIRRRQKQNDIIVAAHGFSEVPPKFFTFATEIILFKTLDNVIKRKDVLRNFEEMKQLQELVNRKAIDNPHFHKIVKL